MKCLRKCQQNLECNGKILVVHVYPQENAIVLPNISTMMVLSAKVIRVYAEIAYFDNYSI